MRKSMHTKKFFPTGFGSFAAYTAAAGLLGLLLTVFYAVPGTTADNAAQSPLIPDRSVHLSGNITDADNDETASYPVFLMHGDSGSDVYRLQTQLKTLGYEVGACSGVYTPETASAVRRFQKDCGFIEDGVCTAAVSHTIAYLSDPTCGRQSDISDEALRSALEQAGCWDPVPGETHEDSISDNTRLRNALILFQRTHGLCGSGKADYATLCALGVTGNRALSSGFSDSRTAADAADFDLRCRLLAEALARYVTVYPKAYNLYTAGVCAAMLCNRIGDTRFPSAFDAICAAMPDSAQTSHDTAYSAERMEKEARTRYHDLLLLRAAEDALRSYLADGSRGYDASHGAVYMLPADRPLPPNAVICLHTGNFVFFR